MVRPKSTHDAADADTDADAHDKTMSSLIMVISSKAQLNHSLLWFLISSLTFNESLIGQRILSGVVVVVVVVVVVGVGSRRPQPFYNEAVMLLSKWFVVDDIGSWLARLVAEVEANFSFLWPVNGMNERNEWTVALTHLT